MDTMSAFSMVKANEGKPQMVFDWVKAAKIIRDEQPGTVEAGLCGDWEWTGGIIFADGKIVTDEYTYLSSNWATPQICVDGEYRDCFLLEHETEWDASTKWPAEALAILNDTLANKE